MTFKSFPKGRLLVHEGHLSTCFCFVLSGQCEVFKIKDGYKHKLGLVNPGDCFGERSMMHLNDKRVYISEINLDRIDRYTTRLPTAIN
jgi:CRP-like cAMP-binding protein